MDLVYPTEEQLDAIACMPKSLPDGAVVFCRGVLDQMQSLWAYPDYFRKHGDDHFVAITGGWSGNESVIHAAQKNYLFWSLCWDASFSGGLHVFRMDRVPRRWGEE